MASTFALFLSVIGMLVVWWCLLIKGVPAMLRTVFERTATQIHRELDEAVVSGWLPVQDASVVSLGKTLEAVVDHSDRLTPAFSKVMNRTMNLHGRPLQVRARSSETFANLSAEQRRLMHQLDRRLARALTRYVKYGSLSGWCFVVTESTRRLATRIPGGRRRRAGAVVRAFPLASVERRARSGEALESPRLAMGALLDAEAEPGIEKPFAQC